MRRSLAALVRASRRARLADGPRRRRRRSTNPTVELLPAPTRADEVNPRQGGIANLTGIPAISVPVGLSSDGLPIGAPAARAWGRDELLLDAAEALERATGRQFVELRRRAAACPLRIGRRRAALSCPRWRRSRPEGLERTFDGDIRAVDGVDLEVAEGEIYAFLGPNGAGKTTTVRMLTTLLRPTGGQRTVAGYDVVTEAARRCGARSASRSRRRRSTR